MVLYDVSGNIDCITPPNGSQDLSLVNCTVNPTQTAGDAETVITIYGALTVTVAALESVFVTVLPVLGGDQVSGTKLNESVIINTDASAYLYLKNYLNRSHFYKSFLNVPSCTIKSIANCKDVNLAAVQHVNLRINYKANRRI